MQLFVKVEEASTDGQPYVTSPKFHQLTTSCEFNLVQTLENILGGDLVHYEIIGPGPWVKWNTLAKELKVSTWNVISVRIDLYRFLQYK